MKALGIVSVSPIAIVLVASAVWVGDLWIHLEHDPVDMAAIAAGVGVCSESCHIARSIVEGKGFSSPFNVETGATAWVSPAYPYLLAGIFKFFGTFTYRSILAAAILNEVLSAITCLPIFFVGKRIGGRALGAIAAWLWVLYPIAVYPGTDFNSYAPLSTFLTALTLWATFAICDSDGWLAWTGYGLLWGFGLLTNPSVMSLTPFLFVWLAWMRWKKNRSWVRLECLAALSMILICVPWTVRNYAVFHSIIPLRSNFGFALFLGNNEASANGGETSMDSTWFNSDLSLGEVALSQEKGREAIQFMLSHPGLELRLTSRRIVQTWLGTSHPIGEFIADRAWKSRVRLILYGCLSFMALFGLLLLLRDNLEYGLVVAVFPVVFPAVYYAAYILPGYRLPIDPVLVVLAALALSTVMHTMLPVKAQFPCSEK